jgi:acetolactate synthase small subunit
MKKDFTLEILSDNNFSVLNRIVNILNRRRVRIKKLIAHENEDNFRRGGAVLLLHTTDDLIEKVKHQLEKLIEVEQAVYCEGCELFFQLHEQNNRQVA